MKMPHRQTETHCQRHAGGGTSETAAEETKESEGRPIAVTKAEFNHPKHAEAEIERVRVEFHDLKSAMGQIENAKRLTLPAISLSLSLSLSLSYLQSTNGSFARFGENQCS